MRVFLTGSTGFIGSYILENLEREFELILPVRDRSQLKITPFNAQIIDFSQDLSYQIKKFSPDIVINTLGILNENPEKGATFEKVHIDYVKSITEGAKNSNVKKIIHISALGADENSKSRYAKTKAEGEKVIISSGIDYVILRPSIVLGRGQKLFDDLKKFSSMTPIIFAPNGKVQPVHILDVVDTVRACIEKDIKNEIIELCGNRIVTYKELFEFALSYIGKKRLVIGMPRDFFWMMLPVFKLFPQPPVTQDQLYLLEKDNVCSGKNKTQKDITGHVRNSFKL